MRPFRKPSSVIIAFFLLAAICRDAGSTGRSDLPERPPVMAGRFYPGQAAELRKRVAQLLERAPGKPVEGAVRALISPHAGYIYSGGVAASAYRHVDTGTKRVILVGPSHHVWVRGASIPPVRAYRTPLGSVPLDPLAVTLRDTAPFLCVAAAHGKEHSLEVQLPFLQVRLETFTILPMLINDTDPQALAAALLPYLDDTTLVVASSDLSHYHPYGRAVSLDRRCVDAVIRMDLGKAAVCEACGKGAILTVMHLAREKGWTPELIDYRNSGDTAGSKDRVVGYAAIAFLDGKEPHTGMERNVLSRQDKEGVLRLARSAITAELLPDTPVVRPASSPALREDRGCFVTLQKDGQLRGCIGCIEPISSLAECIETHARSAAFRDPRFPPVTAEELDAIDIEISVLTVPEAISFADGDDLKNQLKPGVHGVILSRDYRKSTFLPQVWEQLPDKTQFLRHLCLKGGMSADAWKDPKTTVHIYRAEAFGEKEK